MKKEWCWTKLCDLEISEIAQKAFPPIDKGVTILTIMLAGHWYVGLCIKLKDTVAHTQVIKVVAWLQMKEVVLPLGLALLRAALRVAVNLEAVN